MPCQQSPQPALVVLLSLLFALIASSLYALPTKSALSELLSGRPQGSTSIVSSSWERRLPQLPKDMDLSQSIIYFPDTKTTVGKNGKEIRAYDNIVSKGGAIKAVKEINHKDFQITGGSQKEARQKQTIYGFTVNSRGITANSEKKMDIGSNKIVEIDSNGLEQDQLSNAHHWSTF